MVPVGIDASIVCSLPKIQRQNSPEVEVRIATRHRCSSVGLQRPAGSNLSGTAGSDGQALQPSQYTFGTKRNPSEFLVARVRHQFTFRLRRVPRLEGTRGAGSAICIALLHAHDCSFISCRRAASRMKSSARRLSAATAAARPSRMEDTHPALRPSASMLAPDRRGDRGRHCR